MEIGNVETAGKGTGGRASMQKQREEDFCRNACYKCHKVGCRPWKHQPKSETVVAKNLELGEASDSVEEGSPNVNVVEN